MALRKEGDPVPSVDERVAYLEGRVEDHQGAISGLRMEVRELRADMNRQFHALGTRINWVIGSQLATALAVIGALLKR
jgi:hypothetical protein